MHLRSRDICCTDNKLKQKLGTCDTSIRVMEGVTVTSPV